MKLSKQAIEISKRLENLQEREEYREKVRLNTKETEIKDNSIRKIGSTDYKKWEEFSKNIEIDEIITNPLTRQILKLETNSDKRKVKQLIERPSISKMELAILFKNEGDEQLKSKKFLNAIDSYERAQSFIFISFVNEKDENNAMTAIKNSLNMNISMCKMNLEKYNEAILYLLDTLKTNKNNLKVLYRLCHCYYSLDEMENAKLYVTQALMLDSSNKEFTEMQQKILKREKSIEQSSGKIFRKIFK